MESDIIREEFLLATQLNKQGIPLDPEVLKGMEADCAGLLIYNREQSWRIQFSTWIPAGPVSC
jgi:hypothetical protein